MFITLSCFFLFSLQLVENLEKFEATSPGITGLVNSHLRFRRGVYKADMNRTEKGSIQIPAENACTLDDINGRASVKVVHWTRTVDMENMSRRVHGRSFGRTFCLTTFCLTTQDQRGFFRRHSTCIVHTLFFNQVLGISSSLCFQTSWLSFERRF